MLDNIQLVSIGVANGLAEPARRPTKYPAGPENVPAGPVKTDRTPWQALVSATGYAPIGIAVHLLGCLNEDCLRNVEANCLGFYLDKRPLRA